MASRSGPAVEGDLTQDDSQTERRAALDMIYHHSPEPTRQTTLGTAKGYDSAGFTAKPPMLSTGIDMIHNQRRSFTGTLRPMTLPGAKRRGEGICNRCPPGSSTVTTWASPRNKDRRTRAVI